MENVNPQLVLASTSPRRRQLIALGGWSFDVVPVSVDETPLPGERPRDYVRRLAEAKVRVSAGHARAGQIVIGSDTTVVIDDDILGKPADAGEAILMLRRLRGRTHQVCTGIAALNVADGRLVSDVCVTDVPMRAYDDDEIEAYVATGDPLDKAGAYAIQHASFKPVASMDGCFASVMGLPLCHLVRLLKQFRLPPQGDVAWACQAFLQYECPVYSSILDA